MWMKVSNTLHIASNTSVAQLESRIWWNEIAFTQSPKWLSVSSALEKWVFDTRFVELPTLGKSSQFEKHCLFICIYFRFVHLWSQEKCPNCIAGYNSPLLSPGFLSTKFYSVPFWSMQQGGFCRRGGSTLTIPMGAKIFLSNWRTLESWRRCVIIWDQL